tara:strand:- start:518 stop:1012 length:495 start_codon:yes stop_codon:yes gene_type:complete
MDNDQSNDLKNILSKEVIIEEKKEQKVVKKYDPSQDMKDLMEMVDSERVNITNKSWSRIEKSSRLQLLNEYIENYILENSLEGESAKQFEAIVIKAFQSNLLNKQSDIKYDTETNKIIDITILKYNKEKKLFELKTRDNKVKITPKTKSKTNIDKLLNNSKKRR